MAAERVASKSSKDPNVALAFTHQLTKLEVSIAKGAGAEAIDLSAAKLILTRTPATAMFDLAS